MDHLWGQAGASGTITLQMLISQERCNDTENIEYNSLIIMEIKMMTHHMELEMKMEHDESSEMMMMSNSVMDLLSSIIPWRNCTSSIHFKRNVFTSDGYTRQILMPHRVLLAI